MEWTKPVIIDYGSIGNHTFCTPGEGIKGGTTVIHLDKWSEWSSGVDNDFPGATAPAVECQKFPDQQPDSK